MLVRFSLFHEKVARSRFQEKQEIKACVWTVFLIFFSFSLKAEKIPKDNVIKEPKFHQVLHQELISTSRKRHQYGESGVAEFVSTMKGGTGADVINKKEKYRRFTEPFTVILRLKWENRWRLRGRETELDGERQRDRNTEKFSLVQRKASRSSLDKLLAQTK